MSLFRNILVLYICIALTINIAGFPTPFNSFIESGFNFQTLIDSLIASFGFSGTEPNIINLLALPAVIAAIVAGGGFAFPILIAVIGANMLIALFGIPTAIGNFGMPPEIAVVYSMFVVVLQFLFTLGLVDWMRGEMT